MFGLDPAMAALLLLRAKAEDFACKFTIRLETLSEVLANWFVPVNVKTQAKTLLQP